MKKLQGRAFAVLFLLVFLSFAGILAGGIVLAQEGGGAGQGTVTAEEVARAIGKGIEYLRSQQQDDGSWPYQTTEHRQGAAALAILALSEAGVNAEDPAIEKGMAFVKAQRMQMTYGAACTALASASVDPAKHIHAIAEARDFLLRAQRADGMWTYDAAGKSGGDNSNTQFGVLGLYAAMSVGLAVPRESLALLEQHYARTQNRDGGWGYMPGQPSRGSMTAAAVGALYILGGRLYVETDRCGFYRQDPRMAAGMRWLEANFSITTHPGGDWWHHKYYLYALERVGVFTGERYIGGHDWYLEGCRFLADTQNPDGSWMGGRDRLPNTCFALLFLAKGNVPVLVNKLNYGGDWNADVHDAENLTRFVSSKLGQRVGWQSVKMDDSLETLLSAPILYVTGHQFPYMTPEHLAKMRTFFENGGIMVADACCGSKNFQRGLQAFVQSVFPDMALTPIDKSSPIYRAVFNLSESKRVLEGVKPGCRYRIIYSPEDLSCVWERNDAERGREEFQFGVNIAAYATGKERLAPKLEQYKLIASKKAVTATPGAFTLAQVMYTSSNWNVHPMAGPRLLEFINKKAGLSVSSEQVNIALTDRNLSNYPFLYLTGVRRFTLADEEKKALREYIERGGFLFADAACGSPEFDEAFKSIMAEVFTSQPLEAIPPDSPVYHIAYDTTSVTYAAAVRELNPSLSTFTLYGIKVNDRLAVVYSPYDIGAALDHTPAYGSRGLATDDAFKVATNVVLFALSH